MCIGGYGKPIYFSQTLSQRNIGQLLFSWSLLAGQLCCKKFRKACIRYTLEYFHCFCLFSLELELRLLYKSKTYSKTGQQSPLKFFNKHLNLASLEPSHCIKRSSIIQPNLAANKFSDNIEHVKNFCN